MDADEVTEATDAISRTLDTELVGFVRARLAEDEQVALAATAGPWRHNPMKQWHSDTTHPLFPRSRDGEEFVAAGPREWPVCVAVTGSADDRQSMADAAFIARRHPARALLSVVASRHIVDLYEHAVLMPDIPESMHATLRRSFYPPGVCAAYQEAVRAVALT